MRQFLKKLNTELSYDPTIPLLNIFTEEFTSETQIDISIPILTAIVKRRSNTKVQQQISKMWYLQTMTYYIALTWIKFWHMLQGWILKTCSVKEASDIRTNVWHHVYFETSNLLRQEVNSECQGSDRGRDGELLFKEYRVSVWEDEDIVIDSCIKIWLHVMPPTVHVKGLKW